MVIKCSYCNKQFNTQSALNWHLQKDKACLSKRSKPNKTKVNRVLPAQTGHFMQNNLAFDDKSNWSAAIEMPQSHAKYHGTTRQTDNIAGPPPAQKKLQAQPPPVPPKHKRVSSKTELDFAEVSLAANEIPATQSSENTISALQTQLEALKEINNKLIHDKMAYADELNVLKAKIIKQDEELHRWKDKVLTKKEKLVGEDLKNELITLILDSELNVQQVPDDVERQIYGFIIDKLASNRGIFTKLFCCK